MSLISLEERVPEDHFALFDVGFRPFFICAALYALVGMLIWGGLYFFGWHASSLPVSPITWHAHEMIYGYGLAVVAGFLLTAVQNWTGLETLKGRGLQLLLLLWFLARISFWFSSLISITLVALLDSLFIFYLIVATVRPIIRVKQRRQLVISVILLLFLAGNLTFYAGLSGVVTNGIHTSLYSGLYLTLLLILIISRRVFPMFITNGVKDIQPDLNLINRTWVDLSIFALFVIFALLDIFTNLNKAVGVFALFLSVLNIIRLAGWYSSAIWKKPLVWVLYLSHLWIVLGFLLKAASVVFNVSPLLSLHAFAVGGIAMITLGMMARVSLGHTGRNVFQPSINLTPMFLLLSAAAMVRVLFPLIWAQHYLLWIGISQTFWICSFALFVWHFTKILIQPRILKLETPTK